MGDESKHAGEAMKPIYVLIGGVLVLVLSIALIAVFATPRGVSEAEAMAAADKIEAGTEGAYVSPPTGYDSSTIGLGGDGAAYSAEAGIYGANPSEALAAELIICRETGDCPAGVSQSNARQIICDRTGDGC